MDHKRNFKRPTMKKHFPPSVIYQDENLALCVNIFRFFTPRMNNHFSPPPPERGEWNFLNLYTPGHTHKS